jgi:divalent metal cation (Fe/Co/Zn/Cd) transporter
MIGLVLGFVSFFLAYESKGLLIGEGVDRETLRRLRTLVENDDAVEHVSRLLTMYFGPHEVMLALEVKFRDELSMAAMRNAIGRIQKSVQEDYPDITRIFFASESISREQRQGDSSEA